MFRHCHCHCAGAILLKILGTGERPAVNVSAFDFIRLDREVSDRWLNEACPKRPMPSDALDRLKLA